MSPLIHLVIIVPKFVTLVLNFRICVPHSCPTLILGKSTEYFNGTQRVGRIEGDINIYFNDDGRSLWLESGKSDISVAQYICSPESDPQNSHTLSGRECISKAVNTDRKDFKIANRKFKVTGLRYHIYFC